jgi:biopolymer transport protein ExbD
MQIRRAAKPVSILNVTPLIDVVFILLVFFMLATNFANYKLIRIETPRETEVVRTSEGAVVIALAADGSMQFDTRDIDPADLGAEIAAVVAIDDTRAFLIRPSEGVPLQDVIGIYDAARRSGASQVSFSSPEQASGS